MTELNPASQPSQRSLRHPPPSWPGLEHAARWDDETVKGEPSPSLIDESSPELLFELERRAPSNAPFGISSELSVSGVFDAGVIDAGAARAPNDAAAWSAGHRLDAASVRFLTCDQNLLWLTRSSANIVAVDGASAHLRCSRPLRGCLSHRGKLIALSTSGELLALTPGHESVVHRLTGERAHGLYRCGEGALAWIGTQLWALDDQLTPRKAVARDVTGVASTDDGLVLLTNNDELVRLDRRWVLRECAPLPAALSEELKLNPAPLLAATATGRAVAICASHSGIWVDRGAGFERLTVPLVTTMAFGGLTSASPLFCVAQDELEEGHMLVEVQRGGQMRLLCKLDTTSCDVPLLAWDADRRMVWVGGEKGLLGYADNLESRQLTH